MQVALKWCARRSPSELLQLQELASVTRFAYGRRRLSGPQVRKANTAFVMQESSASCDKDVASWKARHCHVGRAISNTRPSVRQSSRMSPPTWARIIAPITSVPNPLCVGGLTGGPAASVQRSMTLSSAAHDHLT